jgi:hypothetical protein
MVFRSTAPIESTDVVEAYQSLLGRSPESEAVVMRLLGRDLTAAALLDRVRGSQEYLEKAAAIVEPALTAVDGYQAVYGIPSLSSGHARDCVDRCRQIEAALLAQCGLANLQHLRLADIGCSMGYIPAYFADRGATVLGYDIKAENVAFCRALFRANGLRGEFNAAPLADALIDQLLNAGVNVVSLLSVLHHVVLGVGIDATRAMLARLLDAGVILVCELARKEEEVSFSWRDALPEDEMALFDRDEVNIVEIGRASALNGVAERKLYLIQRRRFTMRVIGTTEDRSVDIGFLQFSKVPTSPVPFKQYAVTPTSFIKFFRTSDVEYHDVLRRCNAEFMVAALKDGDRRFSQIVGCIRAGRFIGLVFERLVGSKELVAWSRTSSMVQRRAMAVAIAEAYADLVRRGIFWNDCREHNISIDGTGRLVLLDFELAGPQELENNHRRVEYLLWHLAMNERWENFEGGRLTADLPRLPQRGMFDDAVWRGIRTILTAD